MLSNKIRNYVNTHHPYAITCLSSGAKQGYWKTKIKDDQHAERRDILRRNEEDLYQYLYEYYQAQAKKTQTYKEIFEEYLNYLRVIRNLNAKTLVTYHCTYDRFVTPAFGDLCITDITELQVIKLLNDQCDALHPKAEGFKKFVQQLRGVFRYAIKQGYRSSDPTITVDLACYYRKCDITRKPAEKKEFSDSEIKLLMDAAKKDFSNPRALLLMLACETGMRAGELVALQNIDVSPDMIHIHRQLLNGVSSVSTSPGDGYYEVLYTKDERQHPHGGRYYPIDDHIRRILELARSIPGDSPYVFHEPNSCNPIKKDGYEQYLSRLCRRLGISVTNNHGFRMHRNSELIAKGLSSAERAVLLGHAVQTNERFYSLADQRLLSSIVHKLSLADNPSKASYPLIATLPVASTHSEFSHPAVTQNFKA